MSKVFRIIETDNLGGDYPDEKFVNLPLLTREECEVICDIVNSSINADEVVAPLFYKTEHFAYKLQPGFEP